MLRLAANLAIHPDIGPRLASQGVVAAALLALLAAHSGDAAADELVLNTVCALTNLSFYSCQAEGDPGSGAGPGPRPGGGRGGPASAGAGPAGQPWDGTSDGRAFINEVGGGAQGSKRGGGGMEGGGPVVGRARGRAKPMLGLPMLVHCLSATPAAQGPRATHKERA